MSHKRKNKLKALSSKLLSKKKSSNKLTVKNKQGKTIASSKTDKVTIGTEDINASHETCYVVQGDLLFIGTREEVKAHLKKEIGILTLDSETAAKLEATTKIINENFKKSIEGKVKGEAKTKNSAKLGKHVEVGLEAEASAEVTAKAMVDLTKLLVELGVDASANLKIKGAVKIDLKVIEIEGYIEGELNATASAKVSANLKGIQAEAKACAEASASMGAEIKTKPFKIKNNELQIALRPKITAYAKAEAKASAAAGLKSGVSVGASAAIGLRGSIEAALIGSYTIKSGLDEFQREIKKKKTKTKPTVIKDSDLGAAGMEVELELSVGANFEANPFEFKTEKDKKGVEYAIGSANYKVDIPGLVTGPLGAGVGIKVYVKVLNEIVKDVINKLKKMIKDFVLNVVGKILVEQFKKFQKEVKKMAAEIEDFGLELTISVLDFIGKDLTAIDIEIKRRDKKLINLNEEYMKDITNADNKAKLEKSFIAYNKYVEKVFNIQKTKIEAIIKKSQLKAQEIHEKKGKHSKAEAKALATAKSKTESTIKRLKELINTKKGIIIYVEPNRKVLKLDPSILTDTKAHLSEMQATLKSLETFVAFVS